MGSRPLPGDVGLAVRAGRVVLDVRRVLEQLGPVVLQQVGPGAHTLAAQRACRTERSEAHMSARNDHCTCIELRQPIGYARIISNRRAAPSRSSRARKTCDSPSHTKYFHAMITYNVKNQIIILY